MIVRQRDINSTKQDIDQFEKDIAFGKLEIERQIGSINFNLTIIDDLQGEIFDYKRECEDSKKTIKEYNISIKEDRKTLNDLREKLKEMKGIEKTTKPWEKERPNNEQQICEWTGK